MAVVVHGYQYSVYHRIVRMTLAEKGISYDHVEVNPFAEHVPDAYLSLNPFCRVPTLVHNDFCLYETTAITRYIDETFPGPTLQPSQPRDRARMTQIIAIVDSYGYWPMVRQVYSQRVLEPVLGGLVCEQEIIDGLQTSTRVLSALETIAAEGRQLNGREITLADLHLAPMIAYFTAAPEGQMLLERYPKLTAWWSGTSERQSLLDTDPGLPL